MKGNRCLVCLLTETLGLTLWASAYRGGGDGVGNAGKGPDERSGHAQQTEVWRCVLDDVPARI